jgi:ATP synthase protein I
MAEENNRTDEFADKIGKKSSRKIRARKESQKGLWYGLGMFGLVGWSVAVPTLLFLVAGIWIDTNFKSQYSWTLMMLVIGIFLGCLNAWFWVKRESEEK